MRYLLQGPLRTLTFILKYEKYDTAVGFAATLICLVALCKSIL